MHDLITLLLLFHYREVKDYIVGILSERIVSLGDVSVVGSGSSTLRAYLPESDLDLILFTSCFTNEPSQKTKILFTIFNAICEEISQQEEEKERDLQSPFTYTPRDDMARALLIRNVEFINARTKVAHCVVNNIAVDITVNQSGALAACAFLEEADELIGYNHLFKRSLLLIKVPIY